MQRRTACGILLPWPGIEPGPQQWKHRVLTTGLPGNSPQNIFNYNQFQRLLHVLLIKAAYSYRFSHSTCKLKELNLYYLSRLHIWDHYCLYLSSKWHKISENSLPLISSLCVPFTICNLAYEFPPYSHYLQDSFTILNNTVPQEHVVLCLCVFQHE